MDHISIILTRPGLVRESCCLFVLVKSGSFHWLKTRRLLYQRLGLFFLFKPQSCNVPPAPKNGKWPITPTPTHDPPPPLVF